MFLCLWAINRVHIAIEKVTTAWSDGNDVEGRKLCKIVSSKSLIHNSYIGLFLSKNCCERIFAATEKTQEKKINNASFFLFYLRFYHSIKIESYQENRIYENENISSHWIKIS